MKTSRGFTRTPNVALRQSARPGMPHLVSGFTLIELLVVIAIIGLLSSIVLASLNTARQRGMDAQRLSNMQSIQTALELYALDHNGTYPVEGWTSQCSGWGRVAANNVIPGLVSKYLPSMPPDPQMVPGSNQNCYIYASYDNGVSYKLLDYNLTVTNVTTQPNFVDPMRNYGLTRPAGCSGTEGTHTWAIWSSSASMCW